MKRTMLRSLHAILSSRGVRCLAVFFTFTNALCTVAPATHAQQPAPATTAPPSFAVVDQKPPTDSQIATWIADLADDNYSRRQFAILNLRTNLEQCLPAILAAIPATSGNQANELIQILGVTAIDPEEKTGRIAYDALLKISEERVTAKSILAQQLLRTIAVEQKDQALDTLARLGSEIRSRELPVLTTRMNVTDALQINHTFTGTPEDLDCLVWLYGVKFARLEGSTINRKILEKVIKLPNLSSLQIARTNLTNADIDILRNAPDLELLEILYTPIDDAAIPTLAALPISGDIYLFGTKLSSAGSKRLSDLLDQSAELFVGRGGHLGVECNPNSLVLSRVTNGGPADLADIRPQDKLLKINGVKITIFEELRRELAKSAPGDVVDVEFERPVLAFQNTDPSGFDRPPLFETPKLEKSVLKVKVTLGERP